MPLIYKAGSCSEDNIEVSTEPGPSWGNPDSEMVSITTTTGSTTMRRQAFIHMLAAVIVKMCIGTDVLSEIVKANILDAIAEKGE